MGLYPSVKTIDKARIPGNGGEVWTEEVNRFDGVLRYRRVYAGPWVEGERFDCYCCSCGEREGSDPYCRNHGYGFGERPCELHNMPGAADVDHDVMPASVQERRVYNEGGKP